MKKIVVIAASVGFLVPVLFGLVEMILFNAKGGGWEEFVAMRLPYILCPPWALGDGRAIWMIIIPLLNAGLYAGIAAVVVKTESALK